MISFKSFLKEEAVSTWKPLQHNDLTKRGGDRLEVFWDKIKNGEEFFTAKGLVVIDKSEHDRLKAEMPQKGYSTTIKAKGTTLKYPNDFFKTPEFGGKGKGAGTAAEDRYLAAFQKELEAVLMKEEAPYIDLVIGTRTVKCSGIMSTPMRGRRAPKADFTIFDPEGNEVAWISHKAGKTGADFQQYGGLTDPVYNNVKEIQDFVEAVKKNSPAGLGPRETYYRKVKDEKVLGLVLWGLDHGKNGKTGPENVNEFHQGPMKLVKTGGKYKIMSNHKVMNGPGAMNLQGSWEPYYVARYTDNVKYLGIKNARVGVFPMGKVPRTAKEI